MFTMPPFQKKNVDYVQSDSGCAKLIKMYLKTIAPLYAEHTLQMDFHIKS